MVDKSPALDQLDRTRTLVLLASYGNMDSLLCSSMSGDNRAGPMAQQLTALVALVEDLGLVLSTHKQLITVWNALLLSSGLRTHMVHRHTCGPNTHAHQIKTNLFKSGENRVFFSDGHCPDCPIATSHCKRTPLSTSYRDN